MKPTKKPNTGYGYTQPVPVKSTMTMDGENFRSLQAIRELGIRNNFTIDSLIALGTTHYLSAFDSLLPPLLQDFYSLPVSDRLYALLKEPVEMLHAWDKRSAVSSVATTVAIFWGTHFYLIITTHKQMK